MIRSRSFHIVLVLFLTFALAYGLPKVKYQSTDVLTQLAVPTAFAGWTGKDVQTGQQLMDERFNFMNALFLREYRNADNRPVYLYLLDAGNFHNPKVCLTGAGFKTRELNDTSFVFTDPGTKGPVSLEATTILISKKDERVLISYWMIINGKKVDWVQQKVVELWYSLIGKRKAGLMVRIDVPTSETDLPYAQELAKQFVTSLKSSLNTNDKRYVFGDTY